MSGVYHLTRSWTEFTAEFTTLLLPLDPVGFEIDLGEDARRLVGPADSFQVLIGTTYRIRSFTPRTRVFWIQIETTIDDIVDMAGIPGVHSQAFDGGHDDPLELTFPAETAFVWADGLLVPFSDYTYDAETGLITPNGAYTWPNGTANIVVIAFLLANVTSLQSFLDAVLAAQEAAEGYAIAAQAYANQPFDSRADAMAAYIPALQTTLSLLDPLGRKLDYVERPGATALTTNGGTRQWAPALIITGQHYGLTQGTNSTNHVAMNNAILDADGGDTVYALPGAFGLTARINATVADTVLDLGEARFYKADGYVHTDPMIQLWYTAPGSKVIDGYLDGRGIGMGPAIIVRADHCRVIGVDITRIGSNAEGYPLGSAVYPIGDFDPDGYVLDLVVTRCYIHDCLGAGVGQHNSKKSNIFGNTFRNLGLEAVTCDRPSSDDVIINANQIFNVATAAGVGALGLDGGENCVITNNVIDGTSVGSLSGVGVPGICYQSNIANTGGGVISGNTITNCAAGAMRFKTTGYATEDLPGGTAVEVYVSGNRMRNNGGLSIVADAGTTGKLGDNDYGGVAPSVPNTWKGTRIAFQLRQTATLSNITGDGTVYTIPFNTEVKDVGGCCASGVFTAPRTGDYKFSAGVQLTGLLPDSGADTHYDAEISIITSSGYNSRAHAPVGNSGRLGLVVTARLDDLPAGTTVHVTVKVSGSPGALVVDIAGSDSAFTWFNGDLVREAA